METAPKDGTRILLAEVDAVFIGRWSEECQHGYFETRPGWQLFECEDPFFSISLEPTKWMPLPPA